MKSITRKGGQNPFFDVETAHEVRRKYQDGASSASLAKEYGCNMSCLYRLLRGEGPYEKYPDDEEEG